MRFCSCFAEGSRLLTWRWASTSSSSESHSRARLKAESTLLSCLGPLKFLCTRRNICYTDLASHSAQKGGGLLNTSMLLKCNFSGAKSGADSTSDLQCDLLRNPVIVDLLGIQIEITLIKEFVCFEDALIQLPREPYGYFDV